MSLRIWMEEELCSLAREERCFLGLELYTSNIWHYWTSSYASKMHQMLAATFSLPKRDYNLLCKTGTTSLLPSLHASVFAVNSANSEKSEFKSSANEVNICCQLSHVNEIVQCNEYTTAKWVPKKKRHLKCQNLETQSRSILVIFIIAR